MAKEYKIKKGDNGELKVVEYDKGSNSTAKEYKLKQGDNGEIKLVEDDGVNITQVIIFVAIFGIVFVVCYFRRVVKYGFSQTNKSLMEALRSDGKSKSSKSSKTADFNKARQSQSASDEITSDDVTYEVELDASGNVVSSNVDELPQFPESTESTSESIETTSEVEPASEPVESNCDVQYEIDGDDMYIH